MHAYQLADLAAVVCLHGRQLLAAGPDAMNGSLAAYWKASRCRLDRWGRKLRALASHADGVPWSPNATSLIEEILVSEILARAIAAVAAAHDQRHASAESGPLGRNIFATHVDVKRRTIGLVLAPHRDAEQAEDFLALRRQCDRWTDFLLAYLTPHAEVDEYAARPARVSDFAYDARHHLRSAKSRDMALTMVLAGLRSSLVPLSSAPTPNADLNLEIAASVIGCFSPESFDSLGLPRSSLMERLRTAPNETLAVLGEWWQSVPASTATAPTARWRR